MAARDPNTGQFIPAGADRTVDRAYEDFDIQHWRFMISAQADLTSAQGVFEDVAQTEPLGGLQRDELAELVAMELVLVASPNVSGDDEGTFRVSGELSMDSTSHLISLTDSDRTEDVGGTTGLDMREWSVVSDPDILDVWTAQASNVRDTVNGVGGYDSTDLLRVREYRPVYGRGPVLDRHSDLHFHFHESLVGGGSEAEIFAAYTFVWDVFART